MFKTIDSLNSNVGLCIFPIKLHFIEMPYYSCELHVTDVINAEILFCPVHLMTLRFLFLLWKSEDISGKKNKYNGGSLPIPWINGNKLIDKGQGSTL